MSLNLSVLHDKLWALQNDQENLSSNSEALPQSQRRNDSLNDENMLHQSQFSENYNPESNDRQLASKYHRLRPNLEQLIRMCDSKLEEHPSSPRILLIRSSALLKLKRFEEVIRDCTEVIKQSQSEQNAFFYRANAFEQIGELDQSIRDYTQVLAINPNHVNAAYARAACQNMKGNFDLAIQDYQMALDKDLPRIDASTATPIRQYQENLAGTPMEQTSIHHNSPRRESGIASPTSGIQTSLPDHAARVIRQFIAKHSIHERQSSTPTQQDESDDFPPTSEPVGKIEAIQIEKLLRDQSEPPSDPTKLKQMAVFHHQQGLTLRKDGKFQEAIQEYTKAIEYFPGYFRAHFNKAFALDQLGDMDGAIESYSHAIVVKPANAYAYYNRGICFDRRGQPGDARQAIEDFTKGIELQPRNANMYHNRGVTYKKLDNLNEALRDYTRAIQVDSKHFRAYFSRANLLEQMDEHAASLQDLRTCMKLASDESGKVTVLLSIAQVMSKTNELDNAIRHVSKAVHLVRKTNMPNDALLQLLRFRAQVHIKNDDWVNACKDFSRCLKLLGTDLTSQVSYRMEIVSSRLMCLKHLGKMELALKDANLLLQLDPDNLDILADRGFIERKLKRFDEAVTDYKRCCELDTSSSTRYQLCLAYCYVQNKQVEEGVQEYSKIIEKNPQHTHALYNRAVSYDRLGLHEKAIEDFNVLVQLEPRNANVYFNRGSLFDAMGHVDKAMVDYTRALELHDLVREVF